MSENNNKQPLNEYHMSTISKLFLAGVAAWLVGQRVQMKVKGNKQDMEKLAAALVASKKFQNELAKPGATAQSVIEKLGLKNMSAKKFEEITGIEWPM
jgi:hypothetical protein